MTDEKCVLVGQSGGPTAAINASLAGVISAGMDAGARVVGMRYGIQGFLGGRSVELSRSFGDPRDLELLRNTPSSWLGSCRYKLPDPADDEATYQRLFERFQELGATAVLYIGGNDSMDTIAKLGAYGREYGSDIRFIGVPKTIDNDLVQTDHTPGYGSAARFVATAMREIACDANVYDLKSVTFVEIMGRDAGWLAAASALANPDIVLLPEAPLDEAALLARLFGNGPAVLALKSWLGHTSAACGALELACVLACREAGYMPPIRDAVSFLRSDVRFVRTAAPFPGPVGLVESFGFGGQNAALVLRLGDPKE